MLTLKKFIKENRPKAMSVGFHDYVRYFEGRLDKTELETGLGYRFTHPDYPSQSLTLTEKSYYPEIEWNIQTLESEQRHLVYWPNWQLAIGSKIIIADSSSNCKERDKFMDKIEIILSRFYRVHCVKLPTKGYYVPYGIRSLFNCEFAFKHELQAHLETIKRRRDALTELIRKLR